MLEVIKGKYRIVREIARSNDIVYEAMDVSLGRRIALKELNIAPGMTGQPRRERIERFNREAKAAGRLSHPNIVSVFDFGEENGRHFIAMEYLEGQTLRDMMQVRGALPLKEAVEIACLILDALQYAHTNRVIHRDIKPDNIHILPGGQVKLTDFGIARLTEEPALTGDGQVFGTPSYMSPEQIVGKGIDHRSDLFSLGVLLYEMLANRKPFTGDSVVSITYAIMNAPPPPLQGVSGAIEQVVYRALAKDPFQRYSTADEMKRALRDAEQIPIGMSPPIHRTGMNRTNYGYGYNGGVPVPPPPAIMGGYGMGQNGGYGSPAPGYAPPGYAPPSQMPASAPVPAPVGGPLPWSWNNGNPMTNGNSGSAPLPNGASGQIPGAYPVGAPPFPRPPAGPLFEISPGTRAFFTAVVVAVLLGGGIAFGVIAFLRSYDQYKTTMGSQQISSLINQGVAAYNKQDFPTAVAFFEQARAAKPSASEQSKIAFNLSAAYIQLARQAEGRGDWQEAKADYDKALAVAPDNKIAHEGKAGALDHLGLGDAARNERRAAQGSTEGSLPSNLQPSSVSDSVTPAADPQEFLAGRRAQARELIKAGDELAKQGNQDDARAKWHEAISLAPNTPERDAAKARLDAGDSLPHFEP